MPQTLKKKILVTGGAGFIGSHVAAFLVGAGQEVLVLDDLSGGFKENVPEGATFVQGSITDAALLKELFEQHRFNLVFHFAAYAAEGLSHFIKRFNYTNNVIGSVNLINESIKHNIECFVFASSAAVYGTNQPPLKEDLVPMPEDSYGIAKFAVEQELRISKEIFGLEHIIFRLHNVYGERQNIGDKYRNVIGIFMNNIMQGKPVTIFGDGEQTRAFTYIADVVPIICRSIEQASCYGEIFNLGAETHHTVNELARCVIKSMGSKSGKVHLDPRQEVKHVYSDHAKLKKYFGAYDSTSLEQGVARMAQWVKASGKPRPSAEFKEIEVEKNLPPSWRA